MTRNRNSAYVIIRIQELGTGIQLGPDPRGLPQCGSQSAELSVTGRLRIFFLRESLVIPVIGEGMEGLGRYAGEELETQQGGSSSASQQALHLLVQGLLHLNNTV